MKRFFLFLLICSAAGLAEDLKSLESELASREAERKRLQEQLDQTDGKISDLKKRISSEKTKGLVYAESKTRSSGYLYETSDVFFGKKLISFDLATPIRVLGYDTTKEVYQIAIRDLVGYTLNVNLVETPEMVVIKNRALEGKRKALEATLAEFAAESRATESKRLAADAAKAKERQARLVRQYGAEIGSRLAAHEVFFGMTREMAIESRGRPNAINRTVTAGLVSEQWVYDGVYLYFENGKLTSFQD